MRESVNISLEIHYELALTMQTLFSRHQLLPVVLLCFQNVKTPSASSGTDCCSSTIFRLVRYPLRSTEVLTAVFFYDLR